MSDNTQLNSGSGGDLIRSVAKTANAPAKTQMVIVDVGGGADGAPETPWTGTFVSLPLPTGAAQESGGNLAAVAAAAGTTADAAYAGSGVASLVAALKGIYAAIKGTLTVVLSGFAGTPTQSSVSVGTSSALLLAAAAAASFLKVSVPATAANGIWVRWDNGVATQAPPAEYIPPGGSASWVKSTGFLPTSQINAIASAAVAVSLVYN